MTGSWLPSPRSDNDVGQKCEEEQRKFDHVIDALNAAHAQHDFLSDEFLTL